MRDMKKIYDHKAQAEKQAHGPAEHLYRQLVSTLELIERHVKAILSDTEIWCEVYVPGVVKLVTVAPIVRTPQMLLLEAASRVPARAMAVA